MKRTSTFFLFFCGILSGIQSSISAQTPTRREVGIQISGFNFDGVTSFSGFYKKEIRENTYRRWGFLFGSLNMGFQSEEFLFNTAAGLSVGREKRKRLDDKLLFYQGPSFSLIGFVNSNQFGINPGFGWVVGLQHNLNDRWSVNLETTPSVGVSFSQSSETKNSVLSLDGNISNQVSIGLIRRF
jgi:hypothetical protein